MRGTRHIEDPKTGIRVNISQPAQKLVGFGNVNELVKLLMNMMEAMGAQGAYISKRDAAVEISVWRKDGWTGTMKVKR